MLVVSLSTAISQARARLVRSCRKRLSPSSGTGASTSARRPTLKRVALVKVDAAKRVIKGAVLEPETVDGQGEIYSAEVVRGAMFHYMRSWQRRGIMHTASADPFAVIVENYITPQAVEIDGVTFAAGTWWQAWKIHDDTLWGLVASGELTGFSIGGSALYEDL